MPQRVQRTRIKGGGMPADAVYVGRGRGDYGKWGNPFIVGSSAYHVETGFVEEIRVSTAEVAVDLYERWIDGEQFITAWPPPSREEIRAELRGKDLACWCGLVMPCHGNPLLRIANEEET
jgi:hypothetical protein